MGSEAELEEFFDLSLDPLSIIGFDGEFKRVNASFLRLLGYPQAELFKRTALEILHPEDVELARNALAQLAEGQDVAGVEARVVCADGTVRRLEWNARSMPERGVVYAVGRDTTELRTLAQEQAALRRVATLVAQEAAPGAVFAAVTREIGETLGVDATHLGRYDPDGTVVSVAQWGRYPGVALGARFALDGDSVSARVQRSGRPARIDGYEHVTSSIAETVSKIGIRYGIGVPVSVEGRTWGVMIATSKGETPFPPGSEARLEKFTELVATAIANAEARTQLSRLAHEQAALRRVATLVAQGASPSAVFDAVAAEAAGALDPSWVTLGRYDEDEMLTVLAHRGASTFVHVGQRVPLEGPSATSTVKRTGRSARIDDFSQAPGRIGELARAASVRSAVAAPVIVDGRTWGVLAAVWADRAPPPEDTAQRMTAFAELLDTAIANADSRAQLSASRARLLVAGDDARRRVVRDLHDGAQQRLVHTIATLKFARRAFADDPAEAAMLIDQALENAELANDELRELAHGMLPSALTRGGLRSGVGALVSRLGLAVELDVIDERLPAEIEASAYFIVAEALTNVVKHARATRAQVTATVDGGVLAVVVRDDGVGGADPRGHGLLGVADRVDALGGRLRIETLGAGTLVAAELPLPEPFS